MNKKGSLLTITLIKCCLICVPVMAEVYPSTNKDAAYTTISNTYASDRPIYGEMAQKTIFKSSTYSQDSLAFYVTINVSVDIGESLVIVDIEEEIKTDGMVIVRGSHPVLQDIFRWMQNGLGFGK